MEPVPTARCLLFTTSYEGTNVSPALGIIIINYNVFWCLVREKRIPRLASTLKHCWFALLTLLRLEQKPLPPHYVGPFCTCCTILRYRVSTSLKNLNIQVKAESSVTFQPRYSLSCLFFFLPISSLLREGPGRNRQSDWTVSSAHHGWQA